MAWTFGSNCFTLCSQDALRWNPSVSSLSFSPRILYFPAVQTRPWASHSFNKLKEKLLLASDVSYSYSRVTFDRSTRIHQRKILSLAASASVVLFVFLVQSQYFIQENSEFTWNARTYLCWLYMQPPAFIKPIEHALMPCSSDARSAGHRPFWVMWNVLVACHWHQRWCLCQTIKCPFLKMIITFIS